MGKQRGASLVEALVAMLVMAFGMMSVAGIQGRLRYSGETAKQRAEAMRVAQVELERLRGFVALERTDGIPDDAVVFNEIQNDRYTVESLTTAYQFTRTVTPLPGGAVDVLLNVSWRDRSKGEEDDPLSVNWRTALVPVDPSLASSLAIPPDFGVGQRRYEDRHPGIPAAAKKLDNARSVFKPNPTGTTALVFNNRSGMVTQLCTVEAATPSDLLGDNDLLNCPVSYTGGAFLLSGHVVFSYGGTPSAENPNSPVLPASAEVILDKTEDSYSSEPLCFSSSSANALVGVNALDYYCVIPPRVATAKDNSLSWSGRSVLNGLTLAAGGVRVCRYSDDYDGDKAINNSEHPLDYVKVTNSLSKQNFLVVDFESSCPAGQKVDVAALQYRNTVTAAHQP
ncbi:MAG: hypothetical protein J0L58_03130 [Burkholderiales bacterium]|nr:hypothetical protein [Burkholderiales bacterium]